MAHYKSMYDASQWISYHDLLDRDGKLQDRTLTIEAVAQGELVSTGNKKSKKPAVSFVGAKKRLAINKTNGKTIAGMYGNETANWVGKRITIYGTTTRFGDDPSVECVRVRPTIPKGKDSAPSEMGQAPAVEPVETKQEVAQ